MKQQHTLQPKLRFPGFEGDWINFSFKEIFNFTTGKNIKQKEAAPNFEIPCVRYGELYYMYKEVINKIINYTNLDKSELKFSEGDEILLPSAGEDPMDIGSASALTIKDVAIGRTINILKPKKKDFYSSIFASYYINQKLRIKISSLAKGVSISNVYNTDLQTLFINLPSLPEQQKIADYLSTIDTKINLLEEKKTELTRYKKAMMQKLFSQEIRFKDDNGNEFPQWEEKRLGDLLIHVSKRNKDNKVQNVLSVSNTKGFISQEEQFENHRVASKDVSNYKIVSKGEFAYNPSRINIGSIALLRNFDNGIISPMYVVFKVKKELNVNYFNYLTELKSFNDNIKKWCSGSVRETLNFEDLSLFKYSIPTLPEQQKIANFLSAIDASIEKVNEQISQTQSFKKAMLQQLFV